MTAIEYLKAKKRMTKRDGYCGIDCKDCPLSNVNIGLDLTCGDLEEKYPEKAVEIVSKWAEENPPKTILQDFLEKYPNAELEDDGTPMIHPSSLGFTDLCNGDNDSHCVECWSRTVEEAQCRN